MIIYHRDITLIFPSGTRCIVPSCGWSPDDTLTKASSIAPGQRWITVHPNGKHEKGVPVLIQETKRGSGVFHVVGGAGGKLNYLKLKGVRSHEEYKQQAAEKQKAKREEAKAQRDIEKKTGTYQSRQKVKQDIDRQRKQHEAGFIRQVGEAMQWKDLEPDIEALAHLSERARSKALDGHHRELLKRANKAVEAQRQRLLHDADARAEAIGEIPLESQSDISVSDLAPIPKKGGLGYAAEWKRRSEQSGLSEDELQQEAEKSANRDKDSQEISKKRKATAEAIAEEIKSIRRDEPEIAPIKLVEAKQAVELLKAQKLVKQIQKNAREANKDTDNSKEPKAYVLEVGSDGIDVAEDLENDLRTLKTTAFLSEIGKIGDDTEKSIGRHVGVGAYNAVNAVAIAAAGNSLIDRSVVDVLGISGAAQVVARRLHAGMTKDEMEDIQKALEEYHVDHYMKVSDSAVAQALEWQKVAEGIRLDDAVDGNDLAAAKELNAKRQDAIENSRRILGTTLGEMEANAAMIMAIKQGRQDRPFEVSLGDTPIEGAIRQARAIGLERGDYRVESIGGNTFLSVTPEGMDRLSRPVSRDDIEHVRTAMDIMEGRHDEEQWLPLGVANRPDLSAHVQPGVAPRLAEPFRAGDDIAQSIKDYIGGRTADGDTPADILADLLSLDILDKVDDRSQFFTELLKIAPMKDGEGKIQRAESHQKTFENLADDFVSSRYGQTRSALHRQSVPVDQVSVDALHRALSDTPEGVLAYTPVGDLGAKDQYALRSFFAREIAREDSNSASLRQELEEIESKEPEKESLSMFGDVSINPAWAAWRDERNKKAEELNRAGLNWGQYVKVMGSPAKAYAAVQDLVRSKIAKSFHDAHNALRPDSPTKLGRTVITGNLDHLDAIDPDAREKRLADHRQLIDSLRDRVAGRYSSGSVRDKIDAAREAQEAMRQSQMSLFATEQEPDSYTETPLAKDNRYTLGHAAERDIAGMISVVGRNFKPGQPVKLWQASMNGNYINQQRAVKLIDRNKRVVLAQGVGSGKTVIMLAGLTHAIEQGKAKRGIFVVPSIVQGQFAGEALRYLEPGKYKWHIEPGASREERIKGYKDQSNHFSVVTHQSFRDDMIYLAAQHAGVSENEMSHKVKSMDWKERKAWMREVMDASGIDHDYLAVDEGHDLLNRAGKEDSLMANVIDSVAHNTHYYVSASADPVKNDSSEIFDIMHKMDPERWHDKKAFLRKYGVDTPASKHELRRELARYFYPGRIDPGVKVKSNEISVQLNDHQKIAISEIDRAAAKARLTRMRGGLDVDAIKHLSPGSFDGVDTEKHKDIATALQENLGILKETAVRRAIDAHAHGAKLDALSKIAGERKGNPGVVFARSLQAVSQIAERLSKDGHRVVVLTGKNSAKEKAAIKAAFNPEMGDARADILVASDAGAVGMNAQRGQWLVQYDTSHTAKTHAQRNGRIHRLGQKKDIELIDLVANHATERRARKRLAEKYDLRGILTSPLEGLDDTGLASYLHRVRAEKEQKNGSLF